MSLKFVSKFTSISNGTMDRYDNAKRAKVIEVKKVVKLVSKDVREILREKSLGTGTSTKSK